jgi:hypothetical protein
MQLLLLVNDRRAIDRKNEVKARTAADGARCIPKQTSNDEGRTRDLQIEGSETHGRRD